MRGLLAQNEMSESLSSDLVLVLALGDVDPVKTTPQMTRFGDAKVCNNWLQIRIDDHRIQFDYKYKKRTTKSIRKEICTWYCVCVVKPSTTPMTT